MEQAGHLVTPIASGTGLKPEGSLARIVAHHGPMQGGAQRLGVEVVHGAEQRRLVRPVVIDECSPQHGGRLSRIRGGEHPCRCAHHLHRVVVERSVEQQHFFDTAAAEQADGQRPDVGVRTRERPTSGLEPGRLVAGPEHAGRRDPHRGRGVLGGKAPQVLTEPVDRSDCGRLDRREAYLGDGIVETAPDGLVVAQFRPELEAEESPIEPVALLEPLDGPSSAVGLGEVGHQVDPDRGLGQRDHGSAQLDAELDARRRGREPSESRNLGTVGRCDPTGEPVLDVAAREHRQRVESGGTVGAGCVGEPFEQLVQHGSRDRTHRRRVGAVLADRLGVDHGERSDRPVDRLHATLASALRTASSRARRRRAAGRPPSTDERSVVRSWGRSTSRTTACDASPARARSRSPNVP